MRLRYATRAKDDLHIAFEWYEEQRRGLGFEFLDCVEASIETIQQMPKLFAKHHADFRRALVRRGFLFQFFTRLKKKEIVVHAVFDNRQDPDRLP